MAERTSIGWTDMALTGTAQGDFAPQCCGRLGSAWAVLWHRTASRRFRNHRRSLWQDSPRRVAEGLGVYGAVESDGHCL